MMPTEQHGDQVEIRRLEPQPVVSIRATIPVADLGQHQGERLEALTAYLRRRGVQPSGPPFVRYHTFGEIETDVELGIPVVEPVPGEGRIASGELPGGPAVSTSHIGSHASLGDAYARLAAWIEAHGRERNGPSWEVYYWIDPSGDPGAAAWPDPSGWRTELVQPVAESRPL